jgi:5-dehydro-2-deoxygluconokinase
VREHSLDVIAIGRASVDLYGQQLGGRLEDMTSFNKAVGGCAANIAIGAARLGLRSALITRVGGEAMGRFVLEQLAREGVVTNGVATDPHRLTALVLLGVADERTFPLIFYRENCADAALCEDDIDEAFVRSARAVLVTGTHFSQPTTAAAQHKAVRIAKAALNKIVLDIDYRPNLWGLAGHDAGDQRYVRSSTVTRALADVLPLCDLIVGTEEELHIASGSEDTLDALHLIRAQSNAIIVCKRGPMGCLVFQGAIGVRLERGVRGEGFPVDVYNVLGAGDAFMAGFLRGWLQEEALQTCCTYANACGAFAVSRLLCSPEYPTWPELQHFLRHGSPERALRNDAVLSHLHWASTRRPAPKSVMAFAIDHRAQLEAIADSAGAPRARISEFKLLSVRAAVSVANGEPGFGMLLDGMYGREALSLAARHGLWLARPVERPGSRPMDFEGLHSLGAQLVEWPAHQTVKCQCFYHPDDPEEVRIRQERELLRVFDASRTVGRELMVEIIASRNGPLGPDTLARTLSRLYSLGIKPDWWRLEPQASVDAWVAIRKVMSANDSYCRGILLLGVDTSLSDWVKTIAVAASCAHVQGFAVGRTIFSEAAQCWFSGQMSDEAAVKEMASRFAYLVDAWRAAHREITG